VVGDDGDKKVERKAPRKEVIEEILASKECKNLDQQERGTTSYLREGNIFIEFRDWEGRNR